METRALFIYSFGHKGVRSCTEESNKWLLRGLKMLPIHIGSGLEAFQLLPISEALTSQPVCAGTASFWGFSFTLADSGLVDIPNGMLGQTQR